MSGQSSSAANETVAPTGEAALQKHRRVLDELIDMGMDLARHVHAQATAQNASTPGPDATGAFDRIARVVRRTVMLARQLDQPAPSAGLLGLQHRVAARRRILRVVEDTIQRQAGGAERERLQAELLERMDAPELDDEIDLRPIADIVTDIIRDLDLDPIPGAHPWKRRTPADVAELATRAACPKLPPFIIPAEQERLFRLLTNPDGC